MHLELKVGCFALCNYKIVAGKKRLNVNEAREIEN